jgi:hypothetical protein
MTLQIFTNPNTSQDNFQEEELAIIPHCLNPIPTNEIHSTSVIVYRINYFYTAVRIVVVPVTYQNEQGRVWLELGSYDHDNLLPVTIRPVIPYT